MAAIEKLTFEMNAVGNAVPQMKAVQDQLGRVNSQVAKSSIALKQYANTNRALTKTSGNLTRNLGMASLQFQDIAVQASMGTDALRIMTMQGPQLASVFGPKGMIIGALVAVGGALAVVSSKTRETTFDFKKLAKDIAPSFEFLTPIFDAVRRGFNFLKEKLLDGANAIIYGFQAMGAIIGALPEAFRAFKEKASIYFDIFADKTEAKIYSLKASFQDFMDMITFSDEMVPDGDGGLMKLADLYRYNAMALNNWAKINEAALEKMTGATDVFGEALNNITTIDIRDYFKKVQKEAEETTNKIAKSTRTVADMIGDKFGDAFMSLIDGTKSAKDAFRVMATDIIKELYRVFVVKQITGFISSAISEKFPDFGNIEMKASGGPVKGGRPYIVGERGPELMIPNRSGTIIPNDKLGGGGVVVNQVINISTGVQQTVRNEIRQLMPQIAESAKSAVVDGKRRGGSYKRALM